MGFITILDHLVVSGSRFLISVALARLLGLHEFGLYSLLWTIVTFAGAIQIPVAITPMMQLGAKTPAHREAAFFRAALLVQVAYHLGAVVIVTLVGCVVLWSRTDLLETVIALNIYVLFYNHWEFVRRLYYTKALARRVLALDTSLYMAVGLVLLVLHLQARLNIASFLALSAVPAALLSCLTVGAFPRKALSPVHIEAYCRRIWAIAKPSLISNVANFVSGHVFVYATALFLSASAVGAITASRNIFGPLMILLMALENATTRDAVLIHSKDPAGLKKYMARVRRLWLAWVGCYVVAAILFKGAALELVYGLEFRQYENLIVWFAVAHLIQFFSKIQTIELRIQGHYDAIKSANMTTMWLCLALSVPLVYQFGLSGAMFSILMQQLAVLHFQAHPIRLDSRFGFIPVGRH